MALRDGDPQRDDQDAKRRTEKPQPTLKPKWAHGLTSAEIDAVLHEAHGPTEPDKEKSAAENKDIFSDANRSMVSRSFNPSAERQNAAEPAKKTYSKFQEKMEERVARIEAKEQVHSQEKTKVQSRFMDNENER